MKAKDLRDKNSDELHVELGRLRRRLYDMRSQAVTEKLENPRQLLYVRRDVARIHTILSERGIKVTA